jgi:hypothetical protein
MVVGCLFHYIVGDCITHWAQTAGGFAAAGERGCAAAAAAADLGYVEGKWGKGRENDTFSSHHFSTQVLVLSVRVF